MSDYQYYDFRAIDRSLTPSQIDELQHLSSRATINNRRAEFVYQYGAFRGDAEQLVHNMFDLMLHVNSAGARRLLFRLPASLFEASQCDDFLIADTISHYRSGSHIMLDLHFKAINAQADSTDGEGDAIEGSGWLNEMLLLRDELLRGDLRVLYLAWFKAAEQALCDDEIAEDTTEPPLPAGLQDLSRAQQAFAELLQIDRLDIAALALNSPPLSKQPAFKPEEWLPLLSLPEKDDYLLRLSRGEDKLELHLNRRLKMLWQQANATEHTADAEPTTHTTSPERRGIQALLDTCQNYRYKIEKEAAQKAAAAAEHKRQIAAKKRATQLAKLSARKEELWQEAAQLVEQGQAKGYAQAAKHLNDLHDLAAQEGETEQFTPRFQTLIEKYQRRRKFMEHLRDCGLITQ